MYNTTKTNEVDVHTIYDTKKFAKITSETGLNITAPVLHNSETEQFKVAGSGYITDKETSKIVFAGNVNGFGIHYKRTKIFHSININGKSYLHKDIKTGEFGINEKVLKVKLPKQLKDATMDLNKIFVDNKLLEIFHKDLNNVDKDFDKIIIEDIKRDKDRYCN